MKNWLVYKILREVKNSFRETIKFIYRRIFRIISITKDHYYDKKLGGIETGESYTENAGFSLYKDENVYQATPYYILEEMVDYLSLNPEDIFIDLGCGKGRVIFFVAMQKIKKVIGIESHEKLTDIAKSNLNKLRFKKTSIEIIHHDAATFDVKEATLFFLSNPFGEETFTKVLYNIKNSLDNNPRKIRIVYYNPIYRDLLDREDWLVLERNISHNKICIWHNRTL